MSGTDGNPENKTNQNTNIIPDESTIKLANSLRNSLGPHTKSDNLSLDFKLCGDNYSV